MIKTFTKIGSETKYFLSPLTSSLKVSDWLINTFGEWVLKYWGMQLQEHFSSSSTKRHESLSHDLLKVRPGMANAGCWSHCKDSAPCCLMKQPRSRNVKTEKFTHHLKGWTKETRSFDKSYFLNEFITLLTASSFPVSSLPHTPSINSVNNTLKISPQSDHPPFLH